MRRWWVIGCCMVVGAGSAAGQETHAGRRDPPCRAVSSQDRVEDILAGGDIRLASGRVAKLSSIRLPDEGDPRSQALAWLQGQVGLPVSVAAFGDADRWGRVEARLAPLDPASPHLAQSLVAHGLALVDAGEAASLCSPDLLATEAAAREADLGLWSDRRYKPLAAGDPAQWRERIGRFVLVEGRISSVGERRQRSYLNLGPNWTNAITITVPKRSWAIMTARGLTASTLRGRRIRARGFLEHGRGPVVEVTATEIIEFLDQGQTRR